MLTSRVKGRAELMADLREAVLPESGRSVLVVFGFAGLKDYLASTSSSEGDSLLTRLAERLTQAVGGTGTMYEPRRGEFCVLFRGELGPRWTTIPTALDEEAWLIGLRTSFAMVVLPGTATSAASALLQADQRLQAEGGGSLRPQRRF